MKRSHDSSIIYSNLREPQKVQRMEIGGTCVLFFCRTVLIAKLSDIPLQPINNNRDLQPHWQVDQLDKSQTLQMQATRPQLGTSGF